MYMHQQINDRYKEIKDRQLTAFTRNSLLLIFFHVRYKNQGPHIKGTKRESFFFGIHI